MTMTSTTTRALLTGLALATLAATPAAAVTSLTYNFGSAAGTNTTATSKVANAGLNRTLTATARKFTVAPNTLTNLSQTRTANAAAGSATYLLRLTAPGIGVNGGASPEQLDTNNAGTAASPLREGILISSNIANFSLTGLKLSFVDLDDTLQVYGVSSNGSFTSLGFSGLINSSAANNVVGMSLGGAATGIDTSANNGTTTLTLTNPTAYFARYFLTTRVGGDVSFMGTRGQGYRVDTITGSVPEPGTWAMLIVGFGMVGLSARSRRNARAVS